MSLAQLSVARAGRSAAPLIAPEVNRHTFETKAARLATRGLTREVRYNRSVGSRTGRSLFSRKR
jgi:hypothetical protein